MTKRMKKYSGRVLATAGIMLALGLLIWSLMAFALSATVGTYSDATYSTPKTQFGRGLDTVYTNMTGGLGSSTYYAEYWGPSTDGGTDMVYHSRSAQLTSRASGGVSNTYVTQSGDNSGTWQARVLHNPQYTVPQAIVIDVPAKGQVLTAGTPVTLQFHLVDRNGNTMTGTDNRSKIYTFMAYNGSSTSAPGWRARAANASQALWTFNSGTGMYTKSFTPSTATTGLAQLRVYMYNWWGTTNGAIETGDTYSISGSTSNDLYTQEFWYTTGGSTTQTNAFTIASVDSLNPKFVANPGQTTMDYTYYFDLFNANGTAVTSGVTAWTNACRGAAAYVTTGAQPTATVKNAPAYDATAGHWKVTWTLPAPGKYGIDLRATRGNQVRMEDVVQFAASSAFTMLGDVTPPANITGQTAAPSDNRVTLNWTNPGDSDFNGVLILRNTTSITNAPARGQVYDPAGASGPNTIGTSRVVYYGTSLPKSGAGNYIDGDPCVPTQRLVNGTNYRYKIFAFDMPSTLNYSAGVQLSSTPTDTTPPNAVANAGFVEGNMQITVTWKNPTACDFLGVDIWYRTDGTFPTKRDGSEAGTYHVGTKFGGTPGADDSFLHTSGVTNGTPYYYTIWAFDDEVTPNYSTGVSPITYAVPHDVTPPANILNLSVVGGSTTAFGCTLQWTAVGDDGTVGTATKYDIRYSKNPIVTLADWNSAWEAVGAPFPQPMNSGTLQTYSVAGLTPLTQYYFAIRAADEVTNWSGVSNNTSTTTLCNPEISACNQCHLMPPDDELPGAHPRGTGNIGNHDLPIHAGQGGADQCDVCHSNGNVWRNNTTLYQFTHQNGVINISDPGKIGNQYERDNNIGGTFYASTTIVYKYKNYSSGKGYKQTTGYCVNTYCHGAGLSSPQWGLGNIVCGEYCHETPPATGRHAKHYHPGQYYINFGPATQVSGYTSDDGSTGWTPTPSPVDKGTNPAAGGNRDQRYSTFISSSNSTKTFTLPNGTWYVTVCVGDPSGPVNGQTVWVSGNGGTSWVRLIDNFDTVSQKLFKKAVDEQVIVSGNNNLLVKIGNGSTVTDLCYMIINATPEAPKSNNTLLMNTPSEYGFSCGKCHSEDLSQARHAGHVDGPVQRGIRDAENAFDGNSLPKNPLGLYTSVFGNISTYIDGQGFHYSNGRSCENLYCHGSTLHAGGSNHTPTWKDGYIDVTGASICGSCHDAGYADTTPLTNMTTGSHTKHTNKGYAYRFDCYKCHYHTVGPKNAGTGVIPIMNKIYHVNGKVDAYFDPNDNTMKYGTYSSSIKTCYNIYCHSNGLLDKTDQPFWGTTYVTPQWASGSKTCNYCHGTSRPDGMPSYANNSATPNSHTKHVDENKLGCSKCHYNTTRNNGASIYTTMQPSLHVNGTADLTFDQENPGAAFNHSNLQCTNTYCHGLTAPPTWGGVVDCGSCHGIGVGNPNPGIGAHQKHNNGAYSLVTSSVVNSSNTTNYNFTCNFCHYSRTHAGGEYIAGTQTAEVNFNAVNATNGYNNSGATYTRGATLADANNWHYSAGRCANTKCHSDGRGGAPNNTFFTWTSRFPSGNCTNCHNGDATAAPGRRMKSGMHAMHVFTSVYRRACEECHALTASLNTVADKSKHVDGSVEVSILPAYGGTFDGSKNCNNVYCHSNADPSAWGTGAMYYKSMNWTTGPATTCTSCHSNNHVVGGDGARTEDQTLSFNHKEHLNSAANSGYGSRIGCTNCHNLTADTNTSLMPTVPSMHNNMNKDIYYYTSFFNMSGANTAAASAGYWGQWNNPGTGGCTVICHSDGRGNDPIKFPNWSTSDGTYGCNSCHGADQATLTSGSHTKHLAFYACNTCHRLTAGGSYGAPMINVSGFTVHHVNGSSFTSISTTTKKDVYMALNIGGSYDVRTKVCSNTYCHGATSPTWGVSGGTTCTSCHGAPPTNAQHYGHYSTGTVTAISDKNMSNSTNYRFGCGKCHTLSGSNPIHHALGNVKSNQAAEVSFDNNSTPKNPLGSYTTTNSLLWADPNGSKNQSKGTCRNLYCHSNGRGTSVMINWSTKGTSVTCGSCHGASAAKASVTLSAPHNTHVGTDVNNISCARCHTRTASSSTAIGNKANHVNGTKDVYFQAFGTVTGVYVGSTCRNTYCHSDGNGGTAATPTWAAGALTCVSCHKYTKATVTNIIATGSHTAHINNTDANLGSFRCLDCHNKTVMSNNSGIIYGNGTHVNGTKDVYFVNKSLNNVTGAYVSGTKTCRNNYCHSSGTKYTSMTNSTSSPLFRNPTWGGTALDCKGCHGADSAFTSLYGEPNYANRSTASRAWFNSHDKHVKSVTDCGKCHYLTSTTGTSILANGKHINGSRDVNFDPTRVAGGSYDSVNKRCTVPTCHATTMRWGGKAPNSCQSCHSDQGAGTYANHSTTGKHSKHTVTYKFACENCHKVQDTGGNTAHTGNNLTVSNYQTAEIAFRTTSSTWDYKSYDGTTLKYIRMDSAYGASATPTYQTWSSTAIKRDPVVKGIAWGPGRCTNVWCHSNANPLGGTNTYATFPNWSTAETTSCGSCHAAGTAMSSGKHAAHVNNGNLGNFACSKCHTDTVRGSSTVYNYDYHVNGVKNVNFTSIVQANYTGAYVSASYTCRNVYCHSSGQAFQNKTTPVYRTPAWNGSAFTNCKGCHGADSGFTSLFGEPNYANRSTASRAWFNGHYVSSHVSIASDCYKCHATTVLSNGTSISTSGNHLNGTRDVSFSGGGTYDATNKRCSNTAAGCHGSSVMRWGGIGNCQACHGVTTAETNDFVYNNGTKATVNMDQYTSVGHGRIGTYRYSGNAGASNSSNGANQVTACETCHDSTVAHGTSGNLFRIKGGGSPDTLCTTALGCHSVSTTAHHNQTNTAGNAKWVFTPKCVDCHDPHGDDGPNGRHNNYMVQGLVNYTSASSSDGIPAGTNGSLTKAVNFPANVNLPAALNYTSYARSNYTGLCQICHTRGPNFDNKTSPNHYNRALFETQAGHSAGGVCTNCHKHDTGFKGAGDCKGCHNTVQGARRNIQTDFTQASHHIVAASWNAIQATDCVPCHAEGNSDGTPNTTYHKGVKNADDPIDLKVYGTYPTVSRTVAYKALRNNSSITPVCIGCHNDTNKAITPFSDGKTPNTYAWDKNSVDSKYSNTGVTPWGKFNSGTYNVVPADRVNKAYSPHGKPSKNWMPKGLNSFGVYSSNTGKAVQCYDCHNSHSSPITGGASYASGNTDGGIIKTTATYTPTAGGSSGTKNVYSASSDLCFDCHLGDNASAPKTYRDYGIPNGKAITGYYERVGMNFANYSGSRWSTSDVWRGSFAYKDAAFKGGHFGNSLGYMQEDLTTMGTKVNGNCTACHDPHGVSSSWSTTTLSKPVRTVSMSANTSVPTATGTYSGTYTGVYVVQVDSGTTYKVSGDGGKTWGASVNFGTAAAAITGVTVTLPSGTYSVDDTWSFIAGTAATPQFMVPSLKGTWMHSPYKEDRPPRGSYTTDKANGEATARLSTVTNADDDLAANPTRSSALAHRLWDDNNGGTTTTTSASSVGAPAPRGNPDFKSGSYIMGFNVVAVQGDGFGIGPNVANLYGTNYAGTSNYKGWNGYFIDDNTFGTSALKSYFSAGTITPTKMTSANAAAVPGNFAGLCLQCHVWQKSGSGTGTGLTNVTSFTLGVSGKTGSRMKTLPHETVSGMGTITQNLFRRLNNYNAGAWSNRSVTSYQEKGNAMHLMTNYTRSSDGTAAQTGAAGTLATPSAGANDTTPATTAVYAHYYRWAVNPNQGTTTTVDSTYHQFPCSKCHTVHTSRLERLMKTNCLDNDDLTKAGGTGGYHTTISYATKTSNTTTAADLNGARYRNVACHSTKIQAYDSGSQLPLGGGGWNNRTPW